MSIICMYRCDNTHVIVSSHCMCFTILWCIVWLPQINNAWICMSFHNRQIEYNYCKIKKICGTLIFYLFHRWYNYMEINNSYIMYLKKMQHPLDFMLWNVTDYKTEEIFTPQKYDSTVFLVSFNLLLLNTLLDTLNVSLMEVYM